MPLKIFALKLMFFSAVRLAAATAGESVIPVKVYVESLQALFSFTNVHSLLCMICFSREILLETKYK